MHIVLLEPEIPPNTGNIIRLMANSGSRLHLIRPLGFSLEEKRLRRAGLDYHDLTRVQEWDDWEQFQQQHADLRTLAFSTRGQRNYHTIDYRPDDVLLFGPETRGLPSALLDSIAPDHRLRIPMRDDSRSLNLSNTVAIALYEALRQQDFPGLS
ncbi:MAG: tRNA (cytidine(34)-2'-O)-methyltransferase [Pseudomonadota bacterium]